MSYIQRFAGDSILVYDRGLFRLSVFSDSAFVRSMIISAAPGATQLASVPVGLFASGRALVATGAAVQLRDPGPARLERERMGLHVYDREGRQERALGMFNGQEYEVLMMRSGPLAGKAFSRRLRTFGRGSAVLLSGDHVVVADNDSWRVDFFNATGALTQSVRFAQPAVPVTQQDITEYWEARLAATTEPAVRDAVRAIIADVQPPPFFPAFDARLLASQNGSIWIGDFVRPGHATQRWRILGPDGSLHAQLSVPTTVRILDVDERHVLLLVRDDDGVETIELHEFEAAK
jgi:hypothetical protein